MSIIEELASETIRAGGDAVEVEYKDGYEEVFPVKGQFGTSIGFQLDSSSQEAPNHYEKSCTRLRRKGGVSRLAVVNTNYGVGSTTVSVSMRFAWNGNP